MAISKANAGTFVETVSGTSHTASTTLSAGTSRKIIVMTGQDGSGTISGVTYNGQAMTAVDGASIVNASDSAEKATTWYYDVPDALAASDYNVVATTTLATTDITISYWQLAGAATGAPEDAQETQWTTTSTNATITTTSTDGAALMGLAVTTSASQTWTITGTASELTESNETNYTTVTADAIAMSGAGSKTITATVSSASTGNKCLIGVSVAAGAVGPTIDTQPQAASVVLTNGSTASFTVEATTSGGTLLHQWQEDDGGGYANIAGATSATLNLTGVVIGDDGFTYRCNVTDDNGTTATDDATLSVFAGPTSAAIGATDSNGQATVTVSCDYVTGDGEFIRARYTRSGVTLYATATTTTPA